MHQVVQILCLFGTPSALHGEGQDQDVKQSNLIEVNWLLAPQNPLEVLSTCDIVEIRKRKEIAKGRTNKLQNLQELTDRTRSYFNHQKRREDMKEVARESHDRMINAVF